MYEPGEVLKTTHGAEVIVVRDHPAMQMVTVQDSFGDDNDYLLAWEQIGRPPCVKASVVKRKPGDLLFDDTTTYLTAESGARKGMKVTRYDMIPPEALAELAACYGRGEEKYPSGVDGPNWERGMPYSWDVRALETHLAKWKLGHDFDKDDGIHHLAHAAWHLFAILTYQARDIGTDDRVTSR